MRILSPPGIIGLAAALLAGGYATLWEMRRSGGFRAQLMRGVRMWGSNSLRSYLSRRHLMLSHRCHCSPQVSQPLFSRYLPVEERHCVSVVDKEMHRPCAACAIPQDVHVDRHDGDPELAPSPETSHVDEPCSHPSRTSL